MDAVDFVVAPVTMGPVAVDLRVTVGAGSDVGRRVMAGMVRGDSAGSSAQNIPPELVHFPPGPGLPAPLTAVCCGRVVAAPADTPGRPGSSGLAAVFQDPALTGPLPLRPPTIGNRIDGLFPYGFWAAGRGSAGWDRVGSQGFSR